MTQSKYLFLPLLFAAVSSLFTQAAHCQEPGPKSLLPKSLIDFLETEQKRMSLSVDPDRLNMGKGNTQDQFYAPENGNVFDLPSYWVDESLTHAFKGDGMNESIRKIMFRDHNGVEQVRFFVHPESESLYAEFLKSATPADSFHATATSSSRSLLVWKEGVTPFMAKVSLNKEVSAVVRTIPISEISRSIGTHNTFQASRELLPRGFEWMPETLGVIPQGMDRGGMLIREFPEGIVEGKRSFVSLFALYGGGTAQGPPLLVEMINKSGQSPSEFVHTRIIEPFVRTWISTTIDHGFSMEAHAQNSLLELGEDGLPTGKYIFRDLGGFDVDFQYRAALKLPKANSLPFINDFAKEYHQSELDGALLRSVYNHYAGGFVYNLDKFLPQWMEQGLIARETIGGLHFAKMLNDSIRTGYLHRGFKVSPDASGLQWIQGAALEAKRSVANAVTGHTKPQGLGWSILNRLFPHSKWGCEGVLSDY